MTAVERPVVIAGGGIAGLAAAIALAQRGFASHVIEQRNEFPQDGAGIQIGPNGTKLLRALGVAGTLEPHVATPNGIIVHDAQRDRVLTTLPLGQWIAERHGAPYWTMHRRDLHAALLAAASQHEHVKLETAYEARSFESVADGVTVFSRDKPAITGRALIVADGLWSKLRGEIAHSDKPRAIGKAAYRSVVSRAAVPGNLDADAVHLWLAPGCHAVHYPVSGGAEIALVVIRDAAEAQQSWSEVANSNDVLRSIPAQAASLHDLLCAAETWRKWSLHTLAPLNRFNVGRIVAIGDAAHPVLPFLAQGGVLALEDAVSVAEAIASIGDADAGALDRYSLARRQRAIRVAGAASTNGRVYHLHGLAALARNAFLIAAPAHRLMQRYDWLYGWERSAGAAT